jgi:hypothetical protein
MRRSPVKGSKKATFIGVFANRADAPPYFGKQGIRDTQKQAVLLGFSHGAKTGRLSEKANKQAVFSISGRCRLSQVVRPMADIRRATE